MKENTIGIIVGRFQVPNLTEGHLGLFRQVFDKHLAVHVYLGIPRTRVTRCNPLDFSMRKEMILEDFPEMKSPQHRIFSIEDVGDDYVWSEKLDEQISNNRRGYQGVVLYGSRDSFLAHYKGKYPTQLLESKVIVSATSIRDAISSSTKSTPEFREGVIWAAYGQYPKVWTTVDVAVIDRERKQVLLGRKPTQKLFRFLGGFSEPFSDSYEADAIREVKEEADINIHNLKYLGSKLIDDWRYRREVDKIKTMFYMADYKSGQPQACDDIAELKWVSLYDFWNLTVAGKLIVDEHLPLARILAGHIIKC